MNVRLLALLRFAAIALAALACGACGSFKPKVGALQSQDSGADDCDESYEEDGGESYGAYPSAAPEQGTQDEPAGDAGWDADDAGGGCTGS